ncbi:hypothetical protein IF1G_07313 [Cordyceps javanica]|uniref:Uncharacterized protein n=1 Tax=Cordyceps javanica TaxID=43265 RepID=A0A545UY74_9HYPO|nr:hypothetical protein IF1G_07313 [Cordyceps javanica]
MALFTNFLFEIYSPLFLCPFHQLVLSHLPKPDLLVAEEPDYRRPLKRGENKLKGGGKERLRMFALSSHTLCPNNAASTTTKYLVCVTSLGKPNLGK